MLFSPFFSAWKWPFRRCGQKFCTCMLIFSPSPFNLFRIHYVYVFLVCVHTCACAWACNVILCAWSTQFLSLTFSLASLLNIIFYMNNRTPNLHNVYGRRRQEWRSTWMAIFTTNFLYRSTKYHGGKLICSCPHVVWRSAKFHKRSESWHPMMNIYLNISHVCPPLPKWY